MNRKYLHKAGGILIKDRKFLLERHGGNSTYIIPGGKLETGESVQDALIRELMEEFHITVLRDDLEAAGSFTSPAVHSPESIVRIDTFIVKKWSGNFMLDDGIEAVLWVNSKSIKSVSVSATAEYKILPLLLKNGLID